MFKYHNDNNDLFVTLHQRRLKCTCALPHLVANIQPMVPWWFSIHIDSFKPWPENHRAPMWRKRKLRKWCLIWWMVNHGQFLHHACPEASTTFRPPVLPGLMMLNTENTQDWNDHWKSSINHHYRLLFTNYLIIGYCYLKTKSEETMSRVASVLRNGQCLIYPVCQKLMDCDHTD